MKLWKEQTWRQRLGHALPWSVKDDSGQIMVMWPFILIGLCAILGLSIDLASVYLEKGRLQSAVDAASLAGAIAIGENNTLSWQNTAMNISNEDGTTPADYSYTNVDGLSYNNTSGTVTATVTRPVPLYFMRVFGFDSVPVTVTATATTPNYSDITTNPNSLYSYTMVAGSNGITIKGDNVTVDGNILTSGSFSANKGSGLEANSTYCELDSSGSPQGNNNCNSLSNAKPSLPTSWPPKTSSLPAQIQTVVNTQSDYLTPTSSIPFNADNSWLWSGSTLEHGENQGGNNYSCPPPIQNNYYIEGSLTINQPTAFNGIIYVTGDVNINSSFQLNGILFVGGTVTIAGANKSCGSNPASVMLSGEVLAQGIDIHGSTVAMTFDPSYLSGSSGNGIRLIH